MKLDEIGRFVWRFEVFSFKTNAKQFASSAAKKVHAFKCKMTWTYRSMNGHRKASVVWYKCKKTLFSWPAASQLALNGATWRNASYCIRSFSFIVSLTKSESFPQRKRSAGGACGYGWVDVVVPLCRRYSTWMPLNPQCHPDSFSRQKQCKYLAHEVVLALFHCFPEYFGIVRHITHLNPTIYIY